MFASELSAPLNGMYRIEFRPENYASLDQDTRKLLQPHIMRVEQKYSNVKTRDYASEQDARAAIQQHITKYDRSFVSVVEYFYI